MLCCLIYSRLKLCRMCDNVVIFLPVVESYDAMLYILSVNFPMKKYLLDFF